MKEPAVPLQLRGQHRNEHPAAASENHRDRAQTDVPGMASASETDVRSQAAAASSRRSLAWISTPVG